MTIEEFEVKGTGIRGRQVGGWMVIIFSWLASPAESSRRRGRRSLVNRQGRVFLVEGTRGTRGVEGVRVSVRSVCVTPSLRRKRERDDGVQKRATKREGEPSTAARRAHPRPGFWIAAWAENGPTPDLVRTEPGTVRSLEVGTVVYFFRKLLCAGVSEV